MSKELQIRDATAADATEITTLLASLGYPDTEPFIGQHSNAAVTSGCPLAGRRATRAIYGVLSLHFIPQLALAVTFAVSAISVSVMMHVVRVSVRYWKYAQRNSPERAIATG
jgi:hypothetical protein